MDKDIFCPNCRIWKLEHLGLKNKNTLWCRICGTMFYGRVPSEVKFYCKYVGMIVPLQFCRSCQIQKCRKNKSQEKEAPIFKTKIEKVELLEEK